MKPWQATNVTMISTDGISKFRNEVQHSQYLPFLAYIIPYLIIGMFEKEKFMIETFETFFKSLYAIVIFIKYNQSKKVK